MALGNDNLQRVPGVGTEHETAYRAILRGGDGELLPAGIAISGAHSRDTGNIGDLDTLRAGMLLGKRTADNRYAPSIIGVLAEAFDTDGSANTTMTVSAAVATEIVRRIGATGTFKLTGPPTASGAVATQTVTYSAVDTTTGAITVTDPGADAIAGSFIQPTDGSETVLGMVPEGFGVTVTDEDSVDINASSNLLIGGVIDASQIVFWPSNAVLRTWIRDQLRNVGNFTLDYQY